MAPHGLQDKIQTSESGSLTTSVLYTSVFFTSQYSLSHDEFLLAFSSNVAMPVPAVNSYLSLKAVPLLPLSELSKYLQILSIFALNKLPYGVFPLCLPLWTASFWEGRTIILWIIAPSTIPGQIHVCEMNECMYKWVKLEDNWEPFPHLNISSKKHGVLTV